MLLINDMPLRCRKKINLFVVMLLIVSQTAYSLDTLYAAKSTSGSTQDFGTIDPSDGSFTSINEISPTGLGWPLGDIGTEPDSITGEIYSRQLNPDTSSNDLLAIKKSDGTTRWLGVTGDDSVIGFDTHSNKLITRRTIGGTNSLMSIDTSDGSATTIGSGWASGNTTWQAGGIGAVDSVNGTAYQFNSSSNKIYALSLDDGSEKQVLSLDKSGILQITVDHRTGNLYGLRSDSGLFLSQINSSDGSVTDISSTSLGSTSSNYVQSLSSNDSRYYYQAGSDINIVDLTNGTSLGTFTAPLRLFPVGEVVVGGSNDVTASYDITDTDTSLVKIGTGTVTLSGNNSHSNGTSVLGGTISISSDNNLGSGNVTLDGGTLKLSTALTTDNALSIGSSNGTLNTNGSNSTVSGIISGSGQLSKSGTGTLTLSGNNTNSGGLSVSSGTISISSDNNLGSGNVTLDGGTLKLSTALTTDNALSIGSSNGTLNTNGSNSTVSGIISGSGQLSKSGTGTLTLSGNNTNSGGVDIQSGVLKANGSISGNTTLSGGELGGSGTLSSVTNTSGLVAPGNSIGTLTLTGDFVQASGATLAVEFNDSGQSDKLDISGSATLDGAIEFQPEVGSYSASQTYTFIEADGGVSGTFSSQSTTNSTRLGGLIIRLIYNNGNVQFIIESNSYASLGFTGNKGKVASYLDGLKSSASGDLKTVLNEIDILSTADAGIAFSEIDGDIFSSSLGQLSKGARQINDNISSRVKLSGSLSSSLNLFQPIALSPGSYNFGEILSNIPLNTYQTSNRGVWVKGIRAFSNRDSESSLPGYEYDSSGVSMGVDSKISKKLLIGLSSSYVVSQYSTDNNLGTVDTDSFYLGPYLLYSDKQDRFNTSLIFGLHDNDSNRNINFTSVDRIAEGNYDSFDVTFVAEYEKEYKLNNETLFLPKASVVYSYIKQDAFNETGANSLNLSLNEVTSNTASFGLGATINKKIVEPNGKKANIYGTAEILHERNLNSRMVNHNLTGKSKFDVDGVDRNENFLGIKAGYEFSNDNNINSFIEYSGRYNNDYKEHQIQLGIKTSW